jgi:uncharacterized protein YutE (UPF0331/DUF86 family)
MRSPGNTSKDDRFIRFMGGFAAAAELAKRAHGREHHVEYIVLAGSLIDALLRMGLILRHQIETQSEAILADLLYQGHDDSIIGEREIYRRAAAAQVIDAALLDELQDLYSWRNRVIHRYVISEITTEDVRHVAADYHRALSRVAQAVYAVEHEQIVRRVGMVRAGRAPDNDLAAWAKQKHGEVSRIIRPDGFPRGRSGR